MKVESKNIQKLCTNCLLLIAIYPKSDTYKKHSLSIEVSQFESSLVVGESKVGYLRMDEAFSY